MSEEEQKPGSPGPAAAAEEQPDTVMAAEPAAEPAAEGAADAAAAAKGAEEEAAPAPEAAAEEQPAAEAAAEAPAADGADQKQEVQRERSRSRSHDRDHKARSRSRSHDRKRSRSRSRSRDRRRRSRSRSRSRTPDKRRTRRSRFEEETEEEKEERQKKAAAAAAAAATLPSAADPLAALIAANPALAALDPATAAALAQQLQRQQLLAQQQLLQQQAALQAQAVMSKAAMSKPAVDRLTEKQQKAQRELFVGNLAPGAVTEHSLYQVFHSALIAAFPQAAQPGQEPVMRVNITGRFAFVEFRLPEYATAALQLNGQIALMGNTLKIARPSSYVDPSQMRQQPGMGGMMGGAAAGPGVIPGMAPGAFPGVMPGVQLPGPPSVGGGGVDGMATPIPTPFLGVNGMITADVLDNDEEYKEVLLDLAQECSKYGTMLGLKVPRPPPGTAAGLINTGHYGKAFVQFADVPSAQRAKDAISGRMFAGNIVQAYHVPVNVYQSVPEST